MMNPCFNATIISTLIECKSCEDSISVNTLKLYTKLYVYIYFFLGKDL